MVTAVPESEPEMTDKKTRRRGAGLYRDDDGTYHIHVELPPLNGKRRRKHLRLPPGTTAKQAEAVRAKYEVARNAGELGHTRATVDFLLDDWLDGLVLQETTISTYRRTAKNHVRPSIGGERVDKVQTPLVDRLLRDVAREAGPHAAQRTKVVLSQAFDVAVNYGWIPRNPVDRARGGAKIERREIDPPSVEQVDAWIAAAEGPWRVWLQLARATGARKGELCALRWGDVDLQAGIVTIRNSLATPDGQRLLKPTKANRVRTVRIGPNMVAALREYRGAKVRPRAYLFAVDTAGLVPWRPDTTGKQLTAIANEAGIYGVRIHDLRHFAITSMLADGIPVYVVQRRVGHRDVRTTLDTYGHVLPEQDERAALVGDGATSTG